MNSVALNIGWDQVEDVLELSRALAFGDADVRAQALHALEGFDAVAFGTIAGEHRNQFLVSGAEYRTIEAILGAALVAAIRDFADDPTSRTVSHAALDTTLTVCAAHPGLAAAVRLQARRTLNAPQWRASNTQFGRWTSPWSGQAIVDDNGGAKRLEHIRAKYASGLPCRMDTGIAYAWNLAAVRELMLDTLAGIMTTEWWREDSSYFTGTHWQAELTARFGEARRPTPEAANIHALAAVAATQASKSRPGLARPISGISRLFVSPAKH